MSNVHLKGRWKIHSDQKKGELIINSVDDQGKIAGTLYGKKIENGIYDAQSGEIRFSVQLDPPLLYVESYDGYKSGIGTDVEFMFLAGTYKIVERIGTYGWFATPEKYVP